MVLDKYLFRQLFKPIAGAALALTAVAMLSQTLSALDVVVEHGQSAWVLMKITALALPPLISLIAPVALFVGALLALNRLQTDQEIAVCSAAGMSRWSVIAPAFRIAVAFTVISLFLNVWAQPWTFRQMRQEYFRVRTDIAASLVREGEFVQAGNGLTIYVQRVEQNGLLKNPFIYIQRPHGGTTYAARDGRIVERGGAPSLILRRGSNEEFSPGGVLNYLTFNEYALDLSPFIKTDDVLRYKPSDLWMHELVFPNTSQAWERTNRLKFLAEANARVATPLYNIAFVMLALAGVLGGAFNRLGYGRRIAQATAAAAVARILGFAVEAGCANMAWLNVVQYLVPLAPAAWSALVLFGRQRAPRSDRREASGSFASGAVTA